MHFLPFILAQTLPIRWQAPWLLPAVLGVGAALAAAVLWYYPAQVKPVSRPWRYIIPGLRLLAFGALALMIARPVALRARPADDRGVVLVLIDRSRSMAIADHGRDAGQLVALADSLGLLKGQRTASTSAATSDFEQLQAAFAQAIRSQADLEYARVSGRGMEPAEARVKRQVDEVRELGKKLANVPGMDDPSLKSKIQPMGDLPPADSRGAWVGETRRRLEQAVAAMNQFRRQADKRLYDTDLEVKRICNELDRRTRFELSAETLIRPNGLLSRLGVEAPASVFGFADQLTPLGALKQADLSAIQPVTPTAIDDDPDAPPAGSVVWASSKVPLTPDGNGTDLASAISLAAAAAGGKPIRGVVVLTDGQQVATEAGKVPASSGGPLSTSALPPGVPLITLAAAGPLAPRDLAIAEVVTPASAFVGETIGIRTQIRASGGVTIDPSLARLSVINDSSQQDLLPVAIERPPAKTSDTIAWAQFAVRLDQPGVQELRVSIPPAEGEVSLDNNGSRRWVKVLPERLRVAAIAGSGGWDFQYLRSALGRRPWFSVESVMLDPASPRLGLTPAQILRQDVLVLYDVPPTALDRQQWYAVDQLVMAKGGSVIFIAGPGFNASAFADNPIAASLLPFNFAADRKPAWRVWHAEKPSIRLVPGSEFARSDLLRLDDADATNRRWQDLTGVWKVLPVRTPKQGVKTLLRDAETGQAVVTEFHPSNGPGRALYVGTHETWRWRFKTGEQEQERFWRQLVRHAAEEPYAARQGRLALDLDRVVATPGQAVQLRVKVLSEEDAREEGQAGPATQPMRVPPTEALQVQVIADPQPGLVGVPSVGVSPAARVLRTVKLSELADGSGRLRATIADLPPGSYRVRLVADNDPPAALRPEVMLRIEPNTEAEMRNLSGDPDRLRRMTDTTGGRSLTLDQFAAVPGLLASAADDRPRFVEWSLWDSPWLFAFVVGCFGAEWALRKRAGLA